MDPDLNGLRIDYRLWGTSSGCTCHPARQQANANISHAAPYTRFGANCNTEAKNIFSHHADTDLNGYAVNHINLKPAIARARS